MDEATRRARFAGARVAHLATVTPEGRPHVVVCCFAVEGDVAYTAIDDVKAKSTLALARVRNVAAVPLAALLVDHYDEDWSRLWWVRADGHARVVADGSERAHGLDVLAAKYEQYRADRP